MLYTKSDAGAQAIKDRHAVEITRGQRSALILFDGQRSVRAVLDATAALGVTAADVDALVAMGLLRRVGAIDGESVTDASEETPTPEPIQADASLAASPELTDEERARRYRLGTSPCRRADSPRRSGRVRSGRSPSRTRR